MPVPDAVVVSATRTAIGTAFKGTLLDVDALELGTRAEAVRRAGIDPALVVTRRDCSTITFAVDEDPRRDISMAKLASLKPLQPEIEGFSITAGNAAGCPRPSSSTCPHLDLHRPTTALNQPKGTSHG